MTNFSLSALALVFAASAITFTGGVDTAQAQDCTGLSRQACDRAKRAANKPAYKGPVAPTTGEMACLYVIVPKGLTEIVLIAGNSVNGKPITSIGAQSGHTVKDGKNGVAVKEFCFERDRIAQLSAVTVCNGHKPRDGNHHVVAGRYMKALKRHGHVGDYLSLLGTKWTDSAAIYGKYTEQKYARTYGSYL